MCSEASMHGYLYCSLYSLLLYERNQKCVESYLNTGPLEPGTGPAHVEMIYFVLSNRGEVGMEDKILELG